MFFCSQDPLLVNFNFERFPREIRIRSLTLTPWHC